MPAGKYTFMDYVKVGVPLQVIMGLVMVVVIPLFSRSGRLNRGGVYAAEKGHGRGICMYC